MDKIIRNTQLTLLKALPNASNRFALAGGTALELFYLKHRFSKDLDFLSPTYDIKEIEAIVSKFNKTIGRKFKLENELLTPEKAKIRFYTVKIKGTSNPLKIDFVEDVFFDKPAIEKFNEIPVYSVNHIYFQKILTLIGTHLAADITGRTLITGRKETRDIVDVYYLSKKICPLHIFMKDLSNKYQRGLVYWYRSYSRGDVKLGILDLDIYNKNFNVSKMIIHIDSEIKKFICTTIGGIS